jgi:hypothetical protein
MEPWSKKLDSALASIEAQVRQLPARGSSAHAIERLRADIAPLRFHLRDSSNRNPIVAILGGTGTGKSTIVNRLIGRDLSAASFRRTFTAGAIAIVAHANEMPPDWLGVKHVALDAAELPARGQADKLIIVPFDTDLTRKIMLIDTPDLDGDMIAHHAQADRAFRWADAVLFLLTPEKYQMTELVPYYRLARRYHLPAMFAMNKVEQQAVVEDCQSMLGRDRAGYADENPTVFAIPRDDAGYEPPPQINLEALRAAMVSLSLPPAQAREEGLQRRAADLFDRLIDQVITPLLADRREVERAVRMLRAMEAPPAGVDVNPITRQLARRLQQRSILYLMGPQRMLDRVRQVPALLARLPRTAWDLVMRGKVDLNNPDDRLSASEAPDFPALLAEQLTVLHSRIDDCVREIPAGQNWIEQDPAGYESSRIPPERASAIASDEIQQLRSWLENRWNATPRDTRMLQKLLKVIPGGEKLTQWSETAPYLLTIVVAAHHAFFGHIDLMILGGYTLATWLTERLSNEVAARTRQANRAISLRFEQLAHEQIEKSIQWLESRAPKIETLEKLKKSAEAIQRSEFRAQSSG